MRMKKAKAKTESYEVADHRPVETQRSQRCMCVVSIFCVSFYIVLLLCVKFSFSLISRHSGCFFFSQIDQNTPCAHVTLWQMHRVCVCICCVNAQGTVRKDQHRPKDFEKGRHTVANILSS